MWNKSKTVDLDLHMVVVSVCYFWLKKKKTILFVEKHYFL